MDERWRQDLEKTARERERNGSPKRENGLSHPRQAFWPSLTGSDRYDVFSDVLESILFNTVSLCLIFGVNEIDIYFGLGLDIPSVPDVVLYFRR